jgi:hypothetical protein
MAGVEDRARARVRQHGGAQARGDHAAHRAQARRDHPGGRPAAGRGQHRHRRRRDRRALVKHPGDKIAFTGSTEVGKRIQRSLAGTGKRLTLELGGKAANIVFDDAPIDQAVEGIVNGIFFNQGHVCCAGSRLLVQERSPTRSRKLATASPRCASATRSTRTPTSARSTRRPSSTRSASSCERREEEGAEMHQPAVQAAERRAFSGFPPTFFTGVTQPPHRARGDLRAGAQHADLPHAGRGDREGEQHAYGLSAACGPTRARRSSR